MAHRSQSGLRAPEQGRPALAHPWVVSATDLVFLWDDCPRCFYRKVALGDPRPRSPFPAVFGRIDRAMKQGFTGRCLDELAPGAPRGEVVGSEPWVTSAPLVLAAAGSPIVIRGRVDALVTCDDATTAVVDFKTTAPKMGSPGPYSRQLHAYALALEHPAKGSPLVVSRLGLLCFAPDTYEAAGSRAALMGGLEWIEVERDDAGFCGFLAGVRTVLEAGVAPVPAPACRWCAWRGDPRSIPGQPF